MKACSENSIPILHVRWFVLSIAFNFQLNPKTFDLSVNRDRNYEDMDGLMQHIRLDNDPEYLEKELARLKNDAIDHLENMEDQISFKRKPKCV
jgi:hypothetical protein